MPAGYRKLTLRNLTAAILLLCLLFSMTIFACRDNTPNIKVTGIIAVSIRDWSGEREISNETAIRIINSLNTCRETVALRYRLDATLFIFYEDGETATVTLSEGSRVFSYNGIPYSLDNHHEILNIICGYSD